MSKPFITGLLMASISLGQTTSNPDISVIGDLKLTQSNDKSVLSSSGIEVAIQGYVNPFARADVFIHKHNDDSSIELEEAVLSIERGLPGGLGIRLGKMRPDFGRINKEHAHRFPFISAPLAITEILGHEMWGTTGLEPNALLPLPWYSKLSIGIFESGLTEEIHLDSHEDINENGEETGNVISGRWSNFFDLNAVTHLEVGLGGYRDGGQDPQQIYFVDLKFKWRPNKYRSVTWQSEVISGNNPHDHVHTLGHANETFLAGYSFMNFQFDKRWNLGLVGDYSKSNLEGQAQVNTSVFFGFSPVEESLILRVRIGRQENELGSGLDAEAQVIWSLGPHKPHVF